MKKYGYFFIVFGISVLIYAFINQYMVYREQKALMDTINKITSSSGEAGLKKQSSSAITQNTLKNNNKTNTSKVDAIGILEIPTIKLSAAIVEGTAPGKLKYALGHIESTGGLGKTDENFAVAGHRSHTSGRFFNKLGDVKENDIFYITSKDGIKYTYRVFKIEIVPPEKVEVLNPKKGISLATLVTCHPVYNPTKRLIVYGELVNHSLNK